MAAPRLHEYASALSPSRTTRVFPKCHIEKMQGTFRENELYCFKESAHTEHCLGTRRGGCTEAPRIRKRLVPLAHHPCLAVVRARGLLVGLGFRV